MTTRTRDMIRMQGYLLLVMAAAMAVPCIMAWYTGETESMRAFAWVLSGCILIGSAFILFIKPSPVRLKSKDGFLVVSVSWLIASLVGALPFMLSGSIPDFCSAFFESCSGFSTTGASILTDIESLPKSILFWRSFTHWLGGMGILVFIMALLPALGINGQLVANAETPGPTKDKVASKFSEMAKDLYIIYIAFTVLETFLLCLDGLSLYDALIHTFGTVGTGGFSNYNDSAGHFGSAYVEWIIILFMYLAGINFNLFYLAGRRGLHKLLLDEEFRFYTLLIAAVSVLIFLCRAAFGGLHALGETFRNSVFQVVSILTTTGYMTDDYDIWPTFARFLIFLLFFIGGCSSSTAGGVKCVRILVAFRLVRRGISLKLHPHRIAHVTLNERELSNEVVIHITNFIFTYLLILSGGFLLISLNGFDFMSSFTAAATCLGNIGPGFGVFGPTMNFSIMSGFSKLVCSGLMLLGRLELFTLMVLFSRYYWNPNKC